MQTRTSIKILAALLCFAVLLPSVGVAQIKHMCKMQVHKSISCSKDKQNCCEESLKSEKPLKQNCCSDQIKMFRADLQTLVNGSLRVTQALIASVDLQFPTIIAGIVQVTFFSDRCNAPPPDQRIFTRSLGVFLI